LRRCLCTELERCLLEGRGEREEEEEAIGDMNLELTSLTLGLRGGGLGGLGTMAVFSCIIVIDSSSICSYSCEMCRQSISVIRIWGCVCGCERERERGQICPVSPLVCV
jgi:hypothetical protein